MGRHSSRKPSKRRGHIPDSELRRKPATYLPGKTQENGAWSDGTYRPVFGWEDDPQPQQPEPFGEVDTDHEAVETHDAPTPTDEQPAPVIPAAPPAEAVPPADAVPPAEVVPPAEAVSFDSAPAPAEPVGQQLPSAPKIIDHAHEPAPTDRVPAYATGASLPADTAMLGGAGTAGPPYDHTVPRPKPPIRRWRWYIAFILVGVMIGGPFGYYAKAFRNILAEYYLKTKQSSWQPKGDVKEKVDKALTTLSDNPDENLNILVIGYDKGSNKDETGYCRSDVMMLVCLQERDKKAVVLSIPRDTKVEIAGYGTQKINAAHSIAGPAGAIEAVKDLTGLDVHHYVEMDFSGFQGIVDAIGGVPIHLNSPINDPHSGYLPAGDLLLDGWQALVLVRSRNMPGGDIDRIKSQQAFMKALIKKAKEMGSVWKAKELVDIVADKCEMDFTAGQLTNLAEELLDFSIDAVEFITAPGQPAYISGVSYFVVNRSELAEVTTEIDQYCELSDGIREKLADTSTRAEEVVSPDDDVITVLAGSKAVTAAAGTVANELEFLGHDKVTASGIAKQTYAETTVYYRSAAKSHVDKIRETVPELEDVKFIEEDEVPIAQNSTIVIVLGSSFKTPGLVATYGRAMLPAVKVGKTLGTTVVFQ